MWPNIDFLRDEGLDAQHVDHIQQNQPHVNALGDHHKSTQPDWKKRGKKKRYTMAPLNNMHKGRFSYFTILKVASVSSTTTTIKPSWSVLNISYDEQATKPPWPK